MSLAKKAKLNPLSIVILLVLLLDWAALDDITTGAEPDYWTEWDILLFSTITFGVIIYTKSTDIKRWITRKL